MKTAWIIAVGCGLLMHSARNAFPQDGIEAEFKQIENNGGFFLTMVGTGKGEEHLPHLVASTSLPDKQGDEIMRITHKPEGRDGKRFRHYYFRNGSVELIHDYLWNAPPNRVEFRTKAERRLRVVGGKIDSADGNLESASEADQLLADGKRFYEMIKAKQRR